MDRMRRLRLLHFIVESEESLELIAGKHEYLIRPFWSPRVGVVDAVRPLGHKAKVVAGTPNGPEEIRVRVFGHSHDITTWNNDPRGDDLVGSKAVFALQPPVAAAENGRRDSHTFADTSD